MTFRSGLEEKVADLLVTLGVDYEYEETSYPYTIQHQYTPDFVLPNNGVILEVKGYWDPPSRRKIRQVIKDNPEIDLRMVFQDPYKRISKKSKTTYAKWCERYGILWCAAHCISSAASDVYKRQGQPRDRSSYGISRPLQTYI